MYVTRPLSLLRRSPELLSMRPEGPNLGYLVLFDEECVTTNCFGCEEKWLQDLPFPQNKDLTVYYSTGEGADLDRVVFLPVLDEPLSSNRYYVIWRKGKHTGKATASSKEEDIETCCFCTRIKDVKPRLFDPSDVYQQVEIIHKKRGAFMAVSVASDGNPPDFLRRKYWNLEMSRPRLYQLGQAPGIDSALQARLPELDSHVVVVVGKWYCPFMFVKEDKIENPKSQMKLSAFYEVTLERRWDKIFGIENVGGEGAVMVDVVVRREAVFVGEGGKAASEEGTNVGVVWFKSCEGKEERVGLSTKVLERMKWEQERGGWVDGKEKEVRVERREEFGGSSSFGWTKFGCYVLVERFVLKRMDKSVVLAYDFKHTHQIRCKWE